MKWTINSECGLGHIEAATIEDAKAAYVESHGYDFDGYYEGSWWYVADEDGIWVEASGIENMP